MNKTKYYGLLGAVTLTAFGDTFGLLAMEWMVYELTGSKLAMGMLVLCSGVPETLLRLLGSPLTDRLPRGRLMAMLAALRLLAVALPLAAGAAGQLQLWHLYVAAILSGSSAALFMPTAMAVIPEVAGHTGLARAFAVAEAFRNAAALAGPAIAGAVTAAVGTLAALAVNGVCYAGAITLLGLLRTGGTSVRRSRAPFHPRAYLREMAGGFDFYRRYPPMVLIMAMAAVSNFSSIAVWTMMVPYVREVLHRDAAAMGTLSSVFSFGMLAGMGTLAWIGDISRRRTAVMLSGLIGSSLFTSVLGLLHSYTAVLGFLFIAGCFAPFFGGLSSALHGQLVPGDLQGRVNSVRFLIGGSLQPVGALAGAAVAEAFGLRTMLLTVGLLPALCCSVALLVPALKTLDGELSRANPESPAV